MDRICKRYYVPGIILLIVIGISLVPASASAELPWLDISGSFTYDYSHVECEINPNNGKCKKGTEYEVFDYKLTLSDWNITGGNYADGTYFGESADPITNAGIEINGSTNMLYNDASPDNLSFDDTAGAGGGPASLTITDGSTTYMDATLANFYIDDNFFGTQLNGGSIDDDNVTDVTYGSGTGSQYIDELSATTAPFNLNLDFTFNSGGSGGGTAFTEDSSGSFQGKMYAGPAIVPEPVSSLLFLTGGAVLATRLYRRK